LRRRGSPTKVLRHWVGVGLFQYILWK
jgi:hypothetical protein